MFVPQAKFALVAISLAFSSLLTGCALQSTAVSSPEFVPGAAISGTVHGGAQPIFGSKVYLLAVNPTGYGGPGIAASSANASVSLLKVSSTGNAADSIGSYVLTDNSTGGFSVTGDYDCASGFAQTTGSVVTLSGTEQVYLYILGGIPQNTGSANASSGILVALGACNNPTLQVIANELTTTATAYAFAGFATDATHIGSSGTTLALTGLTNAFANVANLAVVSTGAATAGSTSITPPVASLNTIADILAACVQGATANSHCGTLFQYTGSSGATGAAPTDTASSVINLAHNPWPTAAGMTALYGLSTGTGAPFAPGLTSSPTDFTLGLNLKVTGGGNYSRAYSQAVAIDASGSFWVAYTGGNLIKFSSAGAVLSGVNGYTGGGLNSSDALAIDASGNAWVANGNSLSKFSNSGIALSGSSGYTGGGLASPQGLAVDASGNVWATNSLGVLSKFSNAGVALSGSGGYTGGGLANPLGVAIDTSGDTWAVNYYAGGSYPTLSEFSSNGISINTTHAHCFTAETDFIGAAIDPSGNIWVTDNYENSLDVYASNGSFVSGGGCYTGGGLNAPAGIAIDGSGNVWVANEGNNGGLSAFFNAGVAKSGAAGYTGGSVRGPTGVAIDGSGNVWATSGNNSFSELIGAATPVVTPLAANLAAPYGTSTVNRP